ncbi:MAG: 23S rRNA (pseudouridine(1915)-N(3))-methyltransferase RlmH [Bdellovibrionales bacterium CG10_big_fil_rev_8_21_14_0_10_45_34]|nr:MAG: 23S rRNA (pseudouridine(1915)-N(3))-methyltransferase RlmH [Bdellovibrionales bacterium CG10_big_fil_rev_8_21_14_0_10_45_34]
MIRILYITSGANKSADGLAQEFTKRAGAWHKLELVELKVKLSNGLSAEERKQKETHAIIEKLSPRAFKVVLDEKGKSVDTNRFAQLIEVAFKDFGSVDFCIGGAYGWDQNQLKAFHQTLRLSDLTMNHWLAKLVLCEQIYRALSILNNHPYHNV